MLVERLGIAIDCENFAKQFVIPYKYYIATVDRSVRFLNSERCRDHFILGIAASEIRMLSECILRDFEVFTVPTETDNYSVLRDSN